MIVATTTLWRLFSPGIRSVFRASFGCVFPFSFGRQARTRLLTESLGLVPIHTVDRMVEAIRMIGIAKGSTVRGRTFSLLLAALERFQCYLRRIHTKRTDCNLMTWSFFWKTVKAAHPEDPSLNQAGSIRATNGGGRCRRGGRDERRGACGEVSRGASHPRSRGCRRL